jgi:hypothetical protein
MKWMRACSCALAGVFAANHLKRMRACMYKRIRFLKISIKNEEMYQQLAY